MIRMTDGRAGREMAVNILINELVSSLADFLDLSLVDRSWFDKLYRLDLTGKRFLGVKH